MQETLENPEELPLADVAAMIAEATVSTPEPAETTHVAETAKENEPMLDVHVPQATHTWKDFFIHIATICIGLLIAVSLEQTVEYFHHLHQRHVLEEELHGECEYDHVALKNNIADYDARLKWLLEQRKDVDTMLATHGKTDLPTRVLTYPPHGHGMPGSGMMSIGNSSYESAKDDGRLALLLEGERNSYGLVSTRKASYDANLGAFDQASGRRTSYADQFADIGTPMKPMLSRMAEAQLMEYRALLTDEFEKLRSLRGTAVWYLGDLDIALKGGVGDVNAALSGDSAAGQEWLVRVFEIENEARKTYPEDYAKMAAEIDAEDAARDKAVSKGAR